MKSEGFKIIGTVYTQPVLFIYITHLASVSLVFTATSRPFPSIMQHAPSSLGEAQDGSSGMHSSWECLGMSFSLGFPEAQKVNNGGQIENWSGMTSLLLYMRRNAGYELITKILKTQSRA